MLAATTGAVAARQTQTVNDGVYTTEQAVRGKKGYAVYCESCHAADLGGTNSGDSGAPPLRRDGFMEGSDANALFTKTRETMPFDAPASLSVDGYLDILAYIFQENGFPAGRQALSADQESLKRIRIVKPSRPQN
jgi:cytochrome c